MEHGCSLQYILYVGIKISYSLISLFPGNKSYMFYKIAKLLLQLRGALSNAIQRDRDGSVIYARYPITHSAKYRMRR